MTVCIAAIYNNNSILGASDRMLTASDIEFEPPRTKIWALTTSIAVMTAGDTNIQTQVFLNTSGIVQEKIKANPTTWLSVDEVTKIFSDCYYQLKSEISEKEILSPYKLNLETFIAHQKEMSSDFIKKIMDKINLFKLDSIETIITGIDENGTHIYVIRDGEISCHDGIGFASIGIGSYHALSHFMFSSYTRSTLEPKALLTVHQAKKKAEVSPGVGVQTDMFVIGPNLGSFTLLDNPPVTTTIVKDLDVFYKQYTQKIGKLDAKTENKIKDYLTRLTPQETPKQELSPSLSPSASPSPSVSPITSKSSKK